jgi:hypothetical protein
MADVIERAGEYISDAVWVIAVPAAPGGASPYNGAEPFGQPVVPDPMIQDLNATPPPVTSPDAVHMQGDSSLLTRSPQSMAFRRKVQANKLALRQQQKEN